MTPTQKTIHRFLSQADLASGAITVLTGAGISAESGIPTFRGPEGYWTVGSKVYHPQEMATYQMFQQNPKAVWQWYLYRLKVCMEAQPNEGHMALVKLEQFFGSRFTLITQNVDNLHIRAGQSPERTFQIHGNIFHARCSADCRLADAPLPVNVSGKAKNESLKDAEWRQLHCPNCQSMMRPHVLWFDETYNEKHYHLNSSLAAAHHTNLLIVVGTSGSTNLPNQVVHTVVRNGGLIIDINVESNPFGDLAQQYTGGLMLEGRSSRLLPMLTEQIKASFSP